MKLPKFMKAKWFQDTLDVISLPFLLFMVIIPFYMVLSGSVTAVILAPIKFVVWVFSQISF
jgi:hypothetical protein